nr:MULTISPECIES: GNAT family N-acetyltransferase [unclassified Gemella]
MNEEWGNDIQIFSEDNIGSQIFPNENYNYELMKEEYIFVAAYYKNEVVGLAVYKHNWNKYLYLYDLKVKNEFINKSIGKLLINKGKEVEKEYSYNGIYTQTQDNNLLACLFYLKNSFKIGGFDNKVYEGTQ